MTSNFHMKEDSESASLVCREAPPDESDQFPERNKDQDSQPPANKDSRQEEEEEEEPPQSALAQFHEDVLTQAGFGIFHWLVFLIAGLGLAADAIELCVVAYVLPSAEQELCIEKYHKSWLGAISFVGMMIGSMAWGILGDRLGRRRTLLSALATNAIFGVITAFMPTYALFMITRLCSGIGIGGSLPVVFTYYSEFLVRKKRGRYLSLLLMFWAIGGVLVAVLAWGIIPKSGMSIMDSKRLHFGRWRVFLLVCSLPAVVSAVGMAFLPESPRFLLEMGRDGEALYVYKQILAMNNANKTGVEYQLTELELPSKRPIHPISIPSNRGLCLELLKSIESFWESVMQIFSPPNTYLTFLLLIIWTTASFGFYGLSVWFPEYIKSLDQEEFESRALRESVPVVQDRTFNFTMENTHFTDSTFKNVLFSRMLLSHCSFTNCSFSNCTFSDVRSSRSHFFNCDFKNVVFVDTDFYDYKFQLCTFNATYILSTKGGCDLDFDVNFQLSELFFEDLVAQLSVIPGAVISSFVLDKIGRVKTMGISLFLCALSVPFLWLVTDKNAVVAFEAVFSFIAISGWNALDVISTEAYPVNIRTTSYGFLAAISRFAAILGNITFGSLIELPKAIPILASAVVLLLGAACSTKLPETKDYLM